MIIQVSDFVFNKTLSHFTSQGQPLTESAIESSNFVKMFGLWVLMDLFDVCSAFMLLAESV